MTASESNTAADPDDSGPPFPVVDWGYDRRRVDLRVAELVQQLAEEQRRADHAEQALSQLQRDIHTARPQAPEGSATPEADMAQMLEQAGIIAARVLAEAGRRVEATIVAAGTRAADRLKAAAQQASSLEQQARQLLAEAELERAHIQAAATRTAEQLRAGADREARAVVAKARADAELAWQDASRQRRLLQAEAEALGTHRQRMVEQLGRLYAPLGLLVVAADEPHRDARSGSGIQIDQPWPSR
jgi:regulator of protease activity HflC (stomatin/prohibitin superfamily)